MLRKVILSTLLVLCVEASEVKTADKNSSVEMSDYALGVIYSSGLGSGLLHRIYFGDDYYVQNAGIFGGYKNDNDSTLYFNYGLSVAKYLHSSTESAFHVRTMFGAEFEYEENRYSYANYDYTTQKFGADIVQTTINKSAIVDVGLGFELGSRERGNLMLGLDIMYAFAYKSQNDYAFRPSLGISLLYNW